ncbi:MAG: DUF2254 domain-containing protein [Caulobacter sp.]|nr:DUF2254 domain-containing protein [Caulobacter sp.]
MNRWLFLWRQLNRKLWVRASLYAMLGVAVAIAAVIGRPLVPDEVAKRFGGDSVEAVLTILASSMLAVTTFSLGAMVTAYTAVSQAATPRVSSLVTGDPETQKALATFVGAFLYAIVGVTAINAGYYGAEGRAIIFVCSLGVVGLVAFRLLSWVNRLSRIARVGHMIELVEDLTRAALTQQMKIPPWPGEAKAFSRGLDILSPATGYVQNIDRAHLQEAAAGLDCDITIQVEPGALVRQGERLCRLSVADCDDPAIKQIRRAFAVGATRSFEQDPRFGLTVLGEVAARALSPGVNDPGTAVLVMATGLRLLDDWARLEAPPQPDERPRVCSLPAVEADLLDDLFGPPMRYGAGDLVVAVGLQKALRSLAAIEGDLGQAARAMADDALGRSVAVLTSRVDRARLKAAARG